MSDKIYFQWQNEFLLKTIYPLRMEKLRDFLVFFKEIELWEENKDMSESTLDTFRKEYEEKQTNLLKGMNQIYEDEKKYFIEDDLVCKKDYPKLSDEELNKVQKLHASFKQYLDEFKDDPRKEKIFVAQRVAAWEQYQKEVAELALRQHARVEIVHESRRDEEEDEFERLRDQLIPMVEDELKHLKAFSSSCNNMEKRKLEVKKDEEQLAQERKSIEQDIDGIQRKIKPWEEELNAIHAELTYLNIMPSVDDAYSKVKNGNPWLKTANFTESQDALNLKLKKIQEDLFSIIDTTSPDGFEYKRVTVNYKIGDLQDIKKSIETAIRAFKSGSGSSTSPRDENKLSEKIRQANELLLAVVTEIGNLVSFKFALEDQITKKTGEVYTKRIAELNEREDVITQEFKSLHGQILDKEEKLKSIDARLKVLDAGGHLVFAPEKPVDRKQIVIGMAEDYRAKLPKDHKILLEMIVKLFWDHPDDYPLWLQYMVIHFSGMRYASSHGSWADPRILLSRLQEKKSMLGDKQYDTEKMSVSDAFSVLRSLKKDGKLPNWMWAEIVQMTDIRLEEVQSKDWESLNAMDLKEKNLPQWGKYREIVNTWKADELAAWRPRHYDTGQLVVTRAVCNEVAEHIQHMRGHEGAAGLTEKPNWYKREERAYDEKWPEPEWDGPRAYFKRPRKTDDFKEGASILWLRFVKDYPNPWRIAQPLETKEGDGLIRAEYLVKRGEGFWSYDGITRRRKTPAGGTETQYLRWLHEATVAKVAETAEGPVVLTFETALPYENRNRSTIGVFKRFPHDLQYDQGEDGYNPAFVGFVPEAEMPVEHFKDMLNWNKILLKEFKTPAEIEKYQKENIKSNVVLPKKVKSTRVSVLSNLGDDETQIGLAPLPPNTKLYRTRNWGDPILVKQAGLSAKVAKTSNFNPLPLWSNSGDWSAINNSLIIPREDIDRLIKLQVEDDGKIKNKMNWLIYDKYYVRPYWCGDGSGWEIASKIYWGTIAFGNQLVLTDGDATFNTKLPEENEKRKVLMKRLVCFTKWDWDKSHETHPWLIQRATEVDGNDKFNDKPKGGIIYSPLWSPKDWDFYNAYRPEAFYLPTDWLIEVTPAELEKLYPPKPEKNNALSKKKFVK